LLLIKKKVKTTMDTKCEKGYHYHPNHSKADVKGCMKDDDMEVSSTPEPEFKPNPRENYNGSLSIYNAVRNYGRTNDLKSYIGI